MDGNDTDTDTDSMNHNKSMADHAKEEEEAIAKCKNLPPIVDSLGWWFPKVKLASWDPENKKQWRKVRRT